MKTTKTTKTDWLIYALCFAFNAVFYFFLPFAGDDWAWGTDEGLERLSHSFANYNGRYLGNLFVIVMTRNAVVRALLMAAVVFAVCYLTAGIVSKKNRRLYFVNCFCALLFLDVLNLIAVLRIASETTLWISGFANYVSPMAFLLYIYSVLSAGADERRGTGRLVLTGVCSVAAALFVETITLFSIALCGFFLLTGLIRRRLQRQALVALIGTVTGAAVMFSNSSYAVVSAAERGGQLRAIGFSDSVENSFNAIKELLYCDTEHTAWFAAVIAAVVIAAVLPLFLKCASLSTYLPLLCCSVLTVPLFFTNSGMENYVIAARCYFPQYVFYVLYRLLVFDRGMLPGSRLKPKALFGMAAVGCAALCVFHGSVGFRLNACAAVRKQIIAQDLAADRERVRFVFYPEDVNEFQHGSNSYSALYQSRFKRYYGIPSEKKIEFVEYDQIRDESREQNKPWTKPGL